MSERARMLVVDDDPVVADSLVAFLREEGYRAQGVYHPDEALALLQTANGEKGVPEDRFGVVITDASMPKTDGLALLRTVRERYEDVAVVMLTGYGTIESAVDAIRAGAVDYLAKPVVDAELRMALERALRHQALLAENTSLRSRLDASSGLRGVVGSDYRMLKAFEMVDSVSTSNVTVLINGESGTGKSLFARAIHQASERADGPLVEVHCGSIPEALLESELFGHVQGAFTGATTDKPGRFLAADKGTIFIDEINSASQAMQLKLLRVLQDRTFEPVGSTDTIEIDVRVVLATNEPLEKLVAEGRFRQDLYYRINVVAIELPALRERPGDIPRLVEHFVEKHAARHGRTITGVDDEVVAALTRYRFPGNVRELENAIERAVVLTSTPTLTFEDLPEHVRSGGVGPLDAGDDGKDWSPIPLSEAMLEPEKRIILKALRANDWNRQRTADDLAINRTTLYKKIRQFGLDKLAG
ncbi:MAG: sigma-54 dependent transcriptional regulator [Planctomycetota bacterium]